MASVKPVQGSWLQNSLGLHGLTGKLAVMNKPMTSGTVRRFRDRRPGLETVCLANAKARIQRVQRSKNVYLIPEMETAVALAFAQFMVNGVSGANGGDVTRT
jgi:hypothetical protein